ncbi:ABC transporter permease [Marinicellulosiphila megalodicopiae]|uniref:ABC transporter permease n=1 Tax=Marinicellulosiphila megalodicopiae TaxID=2724896 RepID=UPI003BAE1C96
MKQYLFIIKGAMQMNFAYRASTLINLAANLVFIIILYYLWQAIYANKTELNGMTFEQTFLYLVIAATLFNMYRTFTDYNISFDVTSGDIVNYLLKPIDYQLYCMSRALGRISANVIMILIPTALLLYFFMGLTLPLNQNWIFSISSLVFAWLIIFMLDYLIGLLSFYTQSIWGIFQTRESLVIVFSGVMIPFAFFPQWLQDFLEFSPFVAMYYTPITLLMGQVDDTNQAFSMLGNQLFWLLILFTMCRVFFKKATQVITINGG